MIHEYHNGMSIPYEATGRIRQKSRTHRALVDAVHRLLREGLTPTVEQAAEAAGISRTTAYRYFPNQHELLVAAHPEIDAASLLGGRPPTDPEARLDLVLTEIERQILENGPELRAALRLSLDPKVDRSRLLLRQGRAIRWLDDAFRPMRGKIPDRELRRLTLAIRATFGIEAYLWLTEVGGVLPQDALALMRWSAKTLFRSVVPGRTAAARTSKLRK